LTTIHTIASGSSGNALAFSWDGGNLLLDAGISCRRILSALGALGLSAADLDGILITHTHADHVSGLQTLLKRTSCPIYASERACRELDYRFAGILDRLFPLHMCGSVILGGDTEPDVCVDPDSGADGVRKPDGKGKLCRVTAVPASHDAPGTCGWRLDTADGGFAFLTDTGVVTEEARALLPGVRFALLEANHDIEAVRSGPYPYPLKQRILGPWGHLCNEDAGAFAADLVRAGAERIVLAHLSRENNTPSMAESAVRRTLEGAGTAAELFVAPRDGVWLAYQSGSLPVSVEGTGLPDRMAVPGFPVGEAALCGG